MTTDEKGNITKFEEKPKNPTSTLASMGVYCFTWSTLRDYLVKDMKNPNSSHDFGNDIIPQMLKNKKKLKDSNKVSNDELKEQLLMEMKEELLKEIEEEEKNTKEDSNEFD